MAFIVQDFPCLPPFEFVLPSFDIGISIQTPYAAFKINIELGCPFDDNVITITPDYDIPLAIPVPIVEGPWST